MTTFAISSSELGLIACCKAYKLCFLRFVTAIRAFDRSSSYYRREGSSIRTGELGGLDRNDMHSPELTA